MTNLNEHCPDCRKNGRSNRLTQDQDLLDVVIGAGKWGCPYCSYVLGCGGLSWTTDDRTPTDDYTHGGDRLMRAVSLWGAMAAAINRDRGFDRRNPGPLWRAAVLVRIAAFHAVPVDFRKKDMDTRAPVCIMGARSTDEHDALRLRRGCNPEENDHER